MKVQILAISIALVACKDSSRSESTPTPTPSGSSAAKPVTPAGSATTTPPADGSAAPVPAPAAAAAAPQRRVLKPGPDEIAVGAYEVDLDGDAKPEKLDVTDDEGMSRITIDGKPIKCRNSEGVSRQMGSLKLYDLDPKSPGLDLEMSNALGDLDVDTCYITKIGGEIKMIDMNQAEVRDGYIVANGTCEDKAMVYARTATGFEKQPKLVRKFKPQTDCCRGADCP